MFVDTGQRRTYKSYEVLYDYVTYVYINFMYIHVYSILTCCLVPYTLVSSHEAFRHNTHTHVVHHVMWHCSILFIFPQVIFLFGLFSVFILCTTCCCIMYHTILHMLHKIACFALHVVFICVILQLNHQVLSCFFLIYFIWLDITCHTMVLNIIHSIVCFWIDMTSQQWLIGYDILAISYHIMSYPSVSCYHACIWYCIRWCHLISSILSP